MTKPSDPSGRVLLESLAEEVAGLKSEIEALTAAIRGSSVDPSWAADVTGRLTRLPREVVTEVQAVLQLQSAYPTSRPLPGLGGWAVQAQSMVRILSTLRDVKPLLTLECGSGSTSLWIGVALRELGAGKLVSLEHNPQYFELSSAMIAEHDLSDVVDLRFAPLETLDLYGVDVRWYAASSVADLWDIDCLIVDGPPKSMGQDARYPAFPYLHERLADECHIFVDDADREDELSMVKRWRNSGSLSVLPSSSARMAHLLHRLSDREGASCAVPLQGGSTEHTSERAPRP